MVTETEALFPLASVEVPDGSPRALHATDTGLHGVFVATAGVPSVLISMLQFHSMDDVVLFDGGNIGDFANMAPGNPACDYRSFTGLVRMA